VALECSKDAGKLEAWIELRLAATRAALGPVRAYLTTGDTLLVSSSRNGADTVVLRVSKPGVSHIEVFNWGPGAELVVMSLVDRSTGDRLQLLDWKVYREDAPADSPDAVRKRERRTKVSLILMVLAIAPGILAVLLPERERVLPVDARDVFRKLISEVDGGSRKRTGEMHRMLEQVLLYGARPEEIAPPPRHAPDSFENEALSVFFEGKDHLRSRVNTLVEDLTVLQSRLNRLP
jgi:hypothetical protein